MTRIRLLKLWKRLRKLEQKLTLIFQKNPTGHWVACTSWSYLNVCFSRRWIRFMFKKQSLPYWVKWLRKKHTLFMELYLSWWVGRLRHVVDKQDNQSQNLIDRRFYYHKPRPVHPFIWWPRKRFRKKKFKKGLRQPKK
uniref:Uncharacterized protein n=1 Tax=Chromera velia TaxID=505693 RepID=D9IXK7_9ALVE|nr:hypothetical protein CHVEC_pgp041 [Chromera velia]ADJ66535.1 hypothetical protein [Chromera velia]